jgi:hypothetical protein
MRLTQEQSYGIATIVMLYVMFALFRKVFINQQIDFAEIIIDSILITVWLGMTKYIVNNLVYQQYVYPDFKKNREPTKNDNK